MITLSVLKCATNEENETLDRLTFLFRDRGILFTLVGGAACREYGLLRPTKDMDFVVKPYPLAMDILSASGEFNLVVDDCPDLEGRTCTRKDTRTGVLVDFLTGGIRITDHALLGPFDYSYSDPLPIPEPSGFGDVAPLNTLIAMKVGAITSGLDTRALGANCGGREPDDVRQDIDDVRKLISVCQLPRNLELCSASVQRDYEKIYDGDSFTPELLGLVARPLPSK
jgi:hypothetical protein